MRTAYLSDQKKEEQAILGMGRNFHLLRHQPRLAKTNMQML